MRSHLVLTMFVLSAVSCSEEPGPSGVAAGSECAQTSECESGLECQHLVCVDDRGPRLIILSPEPLQVWDAGVDSIAVSLLAADHAPGDQIELVLDPGAPDSQSLTVADLDANPDATAMFTGALASGPHHIVGRLQRSDGTPYANPSALDSIAFFVRDAEIPDTPQIAISWPPPGHVHPIGVPLEVELAVVSFTYANSTPTCQPLPDCQPAFAPECEAECGPVTRMGHVKIFLEDDYPACLIDDPGCGYKYVALLRDDADDVEVDGSVMRGTVPGEVLDAIGMSGSNKLSAALSFDDHLPFPSDEEVAHDLIPITLAD